jgi:cyclophilin family peptidyl-prolyl cis-trans isomerase
MMFGMPKHRKSLIITLGAFLVLGLVIHYGTTRSRTGSKAYGTDPIPSAGEPSGSQSPVASNPKNMQHRITLKTNLGNIVFETYDGDAPKAVENFVTLANKGFYDNVIFHRVISGFMIQTGDGEFGKLPNVIDARVGMGGPGYRFADELDPNSESGRTGYKKGVVAMANAGPDTNGSQFFIMLADYPLPLNYTIFGKVVSGQEVVDAIGALKTNTSDRPLSAAVIEKVSVENLGQ